jgi:AGZA family xanthine/uracil permease-like MFS transporter
MFIAFIGFQNSGLVVDGSTLVSLVSFNALGKTAFFAYAGGTVGGMVPALVVLVGVIAIAIMDKKKVKGSILWGILGSAVLFYILAALSLIGSTNAAATSFFEGITISNPFTAFAEWGEKSAFIVFRQGFDFSGYTDGVGSLIVTLITTALSLCMIDMFDTIGTLYGACRQGDLLDENGTPIRMNKMLLADAIATCVGAFAGTSTVTTFVESSTGVAAGGRTGFTALVVAIGFFVAMFLSPIAELIPSCATATALVWVGVLMMKSVADIDWQDPAEAIVSFLTIAVMAFGYSISKGIGIGIIASVIVKICTGKVKEVSVATWIIAVLYVAMFVLSD